MNMKVYVPFVVALVSFVMVYVLDHGHIDVLPGESIESQYLSNVWAASPSPYAAGSGTCKVTMDSGCAAKSPGSFCGGEVFTGPGDIDCVGSGATTVYSGGTTDCVPTAHTVKVCAYTGFLWSTACTGTTTTVPGGTRRYCHNTGTPVPKEP
jgi:hypothetical protein